MYTHNHFLFNHLSDKVNRTVVFQQSHQTITQKWHKFKRQSYTFTLHSSEPHITNLTLIITNIKIERDRYLRSLTPATTCVVGSRRFKLAGGSFRDVGLDPSTFLARVSMLLFVFKLLKLRPILVASNMSNPAAGTMTSSIQYLRSSFRSNLLLPSFLRFRRARIRIRPSSSDSSSDTEIETLLLRLVLWNIMEDVA